MQTMWTIITRHPSHPPGKWTHDAALYETPEQAIAAAREAWDGTGVQWSLMSIPGREDPDDFDRAMADPGFAKAVEILTVRQRP